MDAKQQYRAHLDLIQQLIEVTARRHLLGKEDRDDFASFVHLKLIEKEARIFRVFQGRCSLRTYLTTVVRRLFNDYRNQRFGRWRISAEARRLGETATLLETLTVRDGYSFEEALEIIVTNHRIEVSRDALADLAARLPVRFPRRSVSEARLDGLAAESSRADEALAREEWETLRGKIETALAQAREDLDEEGRFILKLCFEDGFTVMQIARFLHLEKNRLYRRLKKIHQHFRRRLEREGIHAEDVDRVIGKNYGSVRINFGADPKSGDSGQSNFKENP